MCEVAHTLRCVCLHHVSPRIHPRLLPLLQNHYKQTKRLANVFVHGDSTESFLVAICYPDPDQLKAFCAANGIKGATMKEQVKDPRVNKVRLRGERGTSEDVERAAQC